MGSIGAPLGAVLRAGRGRFNALVAEARLVGGGFAEDAFTRALTGPVDDLASAVAAHDPAAVEPVVDVAYRGALVLTARGERLDGGASPIAELWSTLPSLAGAIVAAPQRVVGSLSNAALALDRTPGTRPGEWVGRLRQIAAKTEDVDTLLAAGRLAAWACGMAHHREPAAVAGRSLPEALQRIAVSGDPERAVDLTDPWAPLTDRVEPIVVGRPVGDFVGLGGLFTLPPMVWHAPDGLHVAAGPADGVWRLHADAFGTTLTRAGTALTRDRGAVSGWTPPDESRTRTSTAATDRTLAWTVDVSYRIHVLGRPAGDGP